MPENADPTGIHRPMNVWGVEITTAPSGHRMAWLNGEPVSIEGYGAWILTALAHNDGELELPDMRQTLKREANIDEIPPALRRHIRTINRRLSALGVKGQIAYNEGIAALDPPLSPEI